MKFTSLLIAPLAATLLLGSSSAFAQPAPLLAPMAAQKPALAPLDQTNWRAIRVKNQRPSMLAFQLDPTHNKLPAFWNMPWFPGMERVTQSPNNKTTEKRAKGPFDLPDNLRLAAADEQNLLFVAGGSDDDIRRLQELVNILDQPMRQVEIEVQLVELPAEEAKQFGIDFSTSRANFDAATAGTPGVAAVPGALQIGFVRNNFQQRLDDLVKAGKAKVISTTPLTFDNNTGRAISLRSGPIDNTGANQNKRPTAPTEGSDTIVTLTPTINGDYTITILMATATLPKNINSAGLETVVNLRDGDTIALTGLPSFVFPDELMKKTEDERVVLEFVTARILRDKEN